MFQSSRIASGIERRQFSTASSPFSASAIWNSRPSRMRRATLRMTLESSTTKHVFIVSSLYLRGRSRSDVRCFYAFHTNSHLRCRRLGAEVEHAVDVEYNKKLAIEPKHAGGYAS